MTVWALAGTDAAGETIGIAGYYLAGDYAIAFTNYREGLSKRDIVRGARALVDKLMELDVDVIASAGFANTAPLEHFGFEPLGPFWRLKK